MTNFGSRHQVPVPQFFANTLVYWQSGACPGLGEPFAGAGLYELLHFRGHATHIRRATENHRISLIEIVNSGDRFLDSP
jgi:hypothetical protein